MSKENNLKNGWNRYCTFINKLPGIKNDTVFGVYLGCACKKHDISYSNEGKVDRKTADLILRQEIYKEFLKENKKKVGKIVSWIMFLCVRLFGVFVWKTWSSKWAERYQ